MLVSSDVKSARLGPDPNVDACSVSGLATISGRLRDHAAMARTYYVQHSVDRD